MKATTIISKLSLAFAASAILSLPAHAALTPDEVQPYLKKQDCMKCHALNKTKKGPSYKKIAEKYKGKPDGEEKVIKNITTASKVKLEDGTEDDHKVIETKDKAELKVISDWILSR